MLYAGEGRLRREIVETARRMAARGIYWGTAGNISVRAGPGFLITPTGVPCEELTARSIVAMTMEGRPRGALIPSSEWRFHRDIYRHRLEIGAVVHTHSTFATTLSCLRRDIPPFHYMVAKAGGRTIACARYETFGTARLSRNALAALEGRRACLLANHGLIALGENLAAAERLAAEVEELAEQYWRALQIGRPVLLRAAEIDAAIEKFRGYGQKARTPRRHRRSRGAEAQAGRAGAPRRAKPTGRKASPAGPATR